MNATPMGTAIFALSIQTDVWANSVDSDQTAPQNSIY